MATGQGEAGRPLPGYVLRDPIRRGATADVWRGEPEERPGRVVAIKRMRTGASRAVLEALYRDAEALTRLSHPSVLPILDIVNEDPGVAIITGYAAGGSLADWLGRVRGGLDPVQVANLGARVGAALVASHKAGIIHGALKPTNILFDAEGQPLVADFGASRLRSTSESAIGTKGYPDPASIAGGRPSEATDIYGLAMTLREALTGVPTSAGSTPQQTPVASDHGVHVPATDLVEAPPDLAATIERGLRRDPADRFATMMEMTSHLDEVRRRLDTANTSPTSDAPPAAPTGPPHRLLILGAILIITIPAGIATWRLASDEGDAPLEDTRVQGTGVAEPRAAPPACPDAVEPALQAPRQPADIDGRGCSVPAAWDGQILEVAIDGDLQRFDLPGDQQDTLLFGDFSCDGRETPALYRSTSGEVFVFPTLDPDDETTVRAQPDGVPDATPRVVFDPDGCARVVLDPG